MMACFRGIGGIVSLIDTDLLYSIFWQVPTIFSTIAVMVSWHTLEFLREVSVCKIVGTIG